jgi:hypothetical protein
MRRFKSYFLFNNLPEASIKIAIELKSSPFAGMQMLVDRATNFCTFAVACNFGCRACIFYKMLGVPSYSGGNLIICAPQVIKHAYCITRQDGRKVVLWFMAEAYPIIKCI